MDLSHTYLPSIIGIILALTPPAFAQVVPEGQCAVIVASRSSLSEAQQWVSQNPSVPTKAIIKYRNDQYAVSLGLIDKVGWRESVAWFVAAGQAPPDAYCSARGAESLAWVASPPVQPPITPTAPYSPNPDPNPPTQGAPTRPTTTALLLFDGETGKEFAGCLNCGKYDSSSVCNKYGDYGSKYSNTSIWNKYGDYGSKYNENSPWNRYGEGLRIVDHEGNYYGRFSVSPYEASGLGIVRNIIAAYEAMEDLEALRNLLCES